MLAHTVAFVQQNNLRTPEELDQKRRIASKQLTQVEDTLRSTNGELRQVNERIHYTSQFLATRATFRQMLNAHNKGKFRNGHATEIDLYQKARDILRSYTPEGRFPSLKSQQARNTKLLKLQKAQSVELENIRKNERTISIAAQNVHYIMEGAVKRVPIAHREGLQNTWKIIRNSHSLSIAIVAEEKCRYVYLSRQYNKRKRKSLIDKGIF